MLPYSPDPSGWSEEQLHLFDFVELALGNREEITKEEAEERKAADEIEKMILAGDGNWRDKMDELYASMGDIDDVDVDEEMIEMINKSIGE